MFRALDIASFFIQLANSIPDDSIDNLKLNKLLYYAQGQALSVLGKPLFEDEIEAWELGPVVSNVYHTYKCWGNSPINEANESFDERLLSAEELNLLVDVYSRYGKYTGIALKDMTHVDGAPWKNVYVRNCNKVIPNDSIKDYFDKYEKIKTLKLKFSEEDIITAIPLNWDSEEDKVYDEV